MSAFRVGLILACVTALGVPGGVAGEKGMPFQATLVWGTNDQAPADSNLQPVSKEVAEKLGKLPFKWQHYYSVKCQPFEVEKGKTHTLQMSDDCEIAVKAVDAESVEVSLRGKGEPVGKVTQKLCAGQMLVTGGNAENFTAWFVVLQRTE